MKSILTKKTVKLSKFRENSEGHKTSELDVDLNNNTLYIIAVLTLIVEVMTHPFIFQVRFDHRNLYKAFIIIPC